MTKENKKSQNQSQRKHREVYLVLLLLLGISVGFAALTTTLSITGNTTVKTQSWDVHFSNVSETAAVADLGAASIVENTNNTEISFTSTLAVPGDYYEFTADVVNNGTINAMVDEDSISAKLANGDATYTGKDGETYDLTDLLKYTVEYVDAAGNKKAIEAKDGVHAEKSVKVKVKVEYNNVFVEATNLPTEDLTVVTTYTIDYVQADKTGVTYVTTAE